MQRLIIVIAVIIAYAIVSGCAVQPRAIPDSRELHGAAAALKLTYGCMQSGYITPDTAATAKIMVQYRLKEYQVDPVYMANLAQSMPVDITLNACNEVALIVAEFNQVAAANRQNAQSTPSYQYVAPRRTVCNNIAGQILCSTY